MQAGIPIDLRARIGKPLLDDVDKSKTNALVGPLGMGGVDPVPEADLPQSVVDAHIKRVHMLRKAWSNLR